MSSSPASPSSAEPAAPAPDPQPAAPRSPYARMTKKNTSVRNIVWALAVIMAFVVVLAVLFFGVGNAPDRTVPESSRLDVTASAERAAPVAPFPVAVPQLPAGWTPRLAEYSGGDVPVWELRYSSPSGDLVTLLEQQEVDAALLSSAVPGAAVEAELEVAGVPCQQLRGTGEEPQIGLSCQGEEWGILVHGGEDPAQLRTLAEAAIADLDG